MKPSQPWNTKRGFRHQNPWPIKRAACEKTQGATPPLICCAPKNQADLDAKTVPGAKQENAEVQMQAQAANVQSQNQSNSNSPKVPGPAPLGQAEPKKMKAALPHRRLLLLSQRQLAGLQPVITVPLPWKSHGRFPIRV